MVVMSIISYHGIAFVDIYISFGKLGSMDWVEGKRGKQGGTDVRMQRLLSRSGRVQATQGLGAGTNFALQSEKNWV